MSGRCPQPSALETTLALINSHRRNHCIGAVRQFAVDVPLLYAECQQWWQICLNLLTNASDAIPRGGVLTREAATALRESVVQRSS
jgi:C4-dicarboxylate-specific signal transduction histidine kinase